MAIWPDAVSGSMLAMKNGLTERGPSSSMVSMASTMNPGPPTPEPKTTPTSSAVRGVDVQARVRRCLLGCGDPEHDVLVRAPDGLEVHPGVGVEIVDLAGRLAFQLGGVPVGDLAQAVCPSVRLDHAVGISAPTGLTMPRPVTATRRLKSGLTHCGGAPSVAGEGWCGQGGGSATPVARRGRPGRGRGHPARCAG